jgi:metal-responsive CopG/Arc/MetJ family transcriptional regulator
MRTTVTLDADIAAEVERLRRDGVGPSEAINDLARRGLTQPTKARQLWVQRTVDLGIKIDISNIGDVLAHLDELES